MMYVKLNFRRRKGREIRLDIFPVDFVQTPVDDKDDEQDTDYNPSDGGLFHCSPSRTWDMRDGSCLMPAGLTNRAASSHQDIAEREVGLRVATTVRHDHGGISTARVGKVHVAKQIP